MTSTGGTNPIGQRRTVGLVLSLSSAVAMVLTTSACVGASEGPARVKPPSTATKSATQVAPSAEVSLERFYKQDLEWSGCGPEDVNQCAKLMVPIDYSHPDGGTLKLAVLKVEQDPQPFFKRVERIGSLVVNPGGPGASGVSYAENAFFVATPSVRAAYDIVGFDPRGVGGSSPIKCLSDRELDRFLGVDPTPDDKTEQQNLADVAKTFGAKCKAKNGPLLGHVSTIEAAMDMDILRAALGEAKLNFLGKSYGTILGATYADLFPTKVGKFVLDGAVRANLTSSQINEGQAVGFETATRAYVRDCVDKGRCPLGTSVNSGMQRLRDFLKQVDAKPLRLNDPYVKALTEGWASLGIMVVMYDEGRWPELTNALRDAFAGKAAPLMTLAGSYADRSSKGVYGGNMWQVFNAVNCLDRPDSGDLAHYQSEARSLSAKAPTWGSILAWGSVACGFWPVAADNPPRTMTAAGSGPIVVVGTTRDPATPYKWAQGMASDLENGHLITFAGDGHTAYMRFNSCVDKAVDAYLLKGVVPRAGLRC